MLKRSIPVVRVSSSRAAEAFYCGQLGFAQGFAYRIDPERDDPCYLGLHRDGNWLHVSSFPGDGEFGSAVYLVVDDVDQLHSDFLAGGVPISLEPTDQTWGNREMYVKDADGNTLRFVEES